MKLVIPTSLVVLLALTLFSMSGCDKTSTQPPGPSTPATGDGYGDRDQKNQAQHNETSPADMEAITVELAKLGPEDAASVKQQRVCPVSGELLGTMGVPIKVAVNGRQVWICCNGCEEKLLASPEEYLAKLVTE